MEENNVEQPNIEKKPKMKPIFTKAIFMILIFIIIVILAFAVIKFIPMVFSSFASVGSLIKSPFESGLTLKANETDLKSDETFRLSFDYEPEENGYYSLSYDCAPSLSLTVSGETDPLECSREYKISPNDRFIDLKATLDKENFYTETDINVSYLNRNREEITFDTITISITNQSDLPVSDLSGSATISSQGVGDDSDLDTNSDTNTDTSSTQSNTSTTNYTYTNSYTYSGKADLKISNARSVSDTVMSFDVSNAGGRATGNWYFNYVIPGESLETSPLQMSLNPGESVRLTMRFEDIDSGNTVITLDPRNLISESSEYNNSATVYLRGDGGGSSYYNNYYDYYNDYDYYDYYDNYYDYDRNDDADLKIINLEVGRMSGSRFIEDDEIDEDDEAAVRFEVVNVGGESTGSWRFEIENTPYDDDDDFRSNRRSSLRPGESEIITVRFDNPDEGRYKIKVTIDSDDDVDEENERNNNKSETLEVEED